MFRNLLPHVQPARACLAAAPARRSLLLAAANQRLIHGPDAGVESSPSALRSLGRGAKQVVSGGWQAATAARQLKGEVKQQAKQAVKSAARTVLTSVSPFSKKQPSPSCHEKRSFATQAGDDLKQGAEAMMDRAKGMAAEAKEKMQGKVSEMGDTMREASRTASAGPTTPADAHKLSMSSNIPVDQPMGAAPSGTTLGSGGGHSGPSTGMQAQHLNVSKLTSENKKWMELDHMIMRDHDFIKTLFKEYQDATDLSVKQKKLFVMVYEMARHNAAEELSLYEFIRTSGKIPDGPAIVDRSLAEHSKLKVDAHHIDQMADDPSNPELQGWINRAMEDFLQHIEEEEQSVLPLVMKHTNKAQQRDIVERFENAESIVTTRPHPMAPDKGAAAMAAHMATKPMDMLRDQMSGRAQVIRDEPRSRKPQGPSTSLP